MFHEYGSNLGDWKFCRGGQEVDLTEPARTKQRPNRDTTHFSTLLTDSLDLYAGRKDNMAIAKETTSNTFTSCSNNSIPAVGCRRSVARSHRTDPVARSLANAPGRRGPISAERSAILAKRTQRSRGGEGIPHEEILSEFGFTSPLNGPAVCFLVSYARADLPRH